MFTKSVAALAFALLSSSVSAQKPTKIEYQIISFDGDLKFFPSEAQSLTVAQDLTPLPVPTVNGNRFTQNGFVLDKGSVSVSNGVVTGWPVVDPNNFYTSLCTAVDGINFAIGPPAITENICKYNFCLGSDGCIFLRSGGPFNFDPFLQTPETVPDIQASITGGTGIYQGALGKAVIKTQSVPGQNANGESVLRFFLTLL